MESSEVIGDRYRLEEMIGRGGMATIFKAVDEQMMGRPVAVKILREVYSSDPKFVTRFQREARAASALQHPNIVQVFDYGQSNGSYYIVMEYIDGMDLRRYLKRRGILPVDRAVEIARAVAQGLGAAHRRGIVHRDVKPQNVMVNDEGLVKLTDFGIASMYKDADAERLTTTGMTLGTVQYYAPEQAQGEIVRPSADVYALGIVIYEMLTGRTPFDGDTPVAVAMKHIQDIPEPPSALNPRIPPTLERIIMRCLEKDPAARFRDGDEISAALNNFLRSPARRGGQMSGATEAVGGAYGMGMYENPVSRVSGPSGPRQDVYAEGFAGQAPVSGRTRAAGAMGRQSGPYGAFNDDQTFDGPGGFGGGMGYDRFDRGGQMGGQAPLWDGPRTRAGVAAAGRQEEQEQKKTSMALVIGIISAALVVLVVGGILVFVLTSSAFAGGSSSSPQTHATQSPAATTVQVPNYVGEDLATAKADATAKGLKVTPKGVSNSATKNQVIDQSLAANSTAKKGDTITLTYSTGLAPITMPSVLGANWQDACNVGKLQQAGLTCNVIYGTSDQYTKVGQIFKTNPPAGTIIDPTTDSTTVDVYVSTGPTTTPTPTVTASPTPSTTVSPSPSTSPSTGAGTGGAVGSTSPGVQAAMPQPPATTKPGQ